MCALGTNRQLVSNDGLSHFAKNDCAVTSFFAMTVLASLPDEPVDLDYIESLPSVETTTFQGTFSDCIAPASARVLIAEASGLLHTVVDRQDV